MEETMLFKALREFTTGLLNQLLVNLAGQEGQMWLDEFKKFLRRETCWVQNFLRRLFETEKIVVGATDGTETFNGSDIFGDRVYGETLPAGTPTLAVNAAVYEQIVDGKFIQVLGSLGETRPRWKNAGQVLHFSRDHRDKLRTDGYATFFELEGSFVAYVCFDVVGQLEVGINPLSLDYVWLAGFRHLFVSPQQ